MNISLLAAALALVALSQPPVDDPYAVDPDGHMRFEHQIPAGHFCQSKRVYDENAARAKARGAQPSPNAHPCECTYSCHVMDNGDLIETGGEKSTKCAASCSKDGRRCTCHTEEPCDMGHNIALKDMNGTVVAMSRR